MSTTDTEPSVWIGCLACYNAGRLVGDWFPAIDAGAVTTQQVHDAGNGPTVNAGGYIGRGWDEAPHEELWVMDHEYLPIKGECSPAEAQQVAEVVAAIEEDGQPVEAVQLWSPAALGRDFPEEWDAPTSTAFGDAFVGSFDSWRDYADELASDTLGQLDAADFVRTYFDFERHADDLAHGYTIHRWVVDTPDTYLSGVYVFVDG